VNQVRITQQQLLQLIRSANALSNVDDLENQIRETTTQALPEGAWPDDLEPLPSLRSQIAAMLKAQGNFAKALKRCLNGVLLLERRTGDTWVRSLFKLLQILSRVLTPYKQDATPGFPREGQI
jgi:hypothetical protein